MHLDSSKYTLALGKGDEQIFKGGGNKSSSVDHPI